MTDTLFDRVADAFIVGSLETFNHDSASGEILASWSSLQQIIDSLDDHNQVMLDAFETASPEVFKMIIEFMNSPSQQVQDLWMELINIAFSTVSVKIEGP